MRRFLCLAIANLAIVVTSCADDGYNEFTAAIQVTGPTTAHAVDRNFPASLKGREEVPPVDTKAAGQAKFQLSKDGSELAFKLIVANIEDVTQAHIHLAPVGVNGDIVVFLFGFDPAGVTTNGILSEGTITTDDLIGPLLGATLDDLVAELRSGDAYVNVHTIVHPGGEIRGQIRTSGPKE